MLLLFSFFSFILLIFIFKNISTKLNLIDIPYKRKIHNGNIPLIGGLAIYLNSIFLLFFLDISSSLQNIIFISSILVFLGAIDDSIGLGVKFRLIAQLISSLLIVGLGIQITTLGDIFYFGNINLSYLSLIFTVFCVIGLTNSFNFIDGIDGLCSGQSLISIFSIIFLIFYTNNNYIDQNLIYLFFICFVIFLFFIFNISNFYKVFLGDSGSTFLGFFIAWLLIFFSQGDNILLQPFLTIWCVTLPVFDTISVVSRRIFNKSNPFNPDREHIHHILISIGFNDKKTLLILLLVSILLNLIGFTTFYFGGNIISIIFFLVLSLIYTLILRFLSKKKNL